MSLVATVTTVEIARKVGMEGFECVFGTFVSFQKEGSDLSTEAER